MSGRGRLSTAVLSSLLLLAAVISPVVLPNAGAQAVRNGSGQATDAVAGLSPALQQEFFAGAALFTKAWTQADGLGPLVNAQGCIGCHSHPTRGGASPRRENLVTLSPEVTDPSGGRVFQLFELRARDSTRVRPLPRLVSRRRAPPLYGLGLLEAAVADAAGGTSRSRGRFGWKARFEGIDAAVEAAFANEMGMLGPHLARTTSPEVSAAQILLVSQFVRLLAPPPASGVASQADSQMFTTLGCASCHRPELRTGNSPIPALRYQRITSYTDLKLHDMGPELAQGWDDGNIRGAEFRTPPLWGIDRIGPPYLHDGRAETLDGAIRAHGGEAAASARAYRRLDRMRRQDVLRFIRAL